MGKKIPISVRLEQKTTRVGECLIWNGCAGTDGYPIAGFGHGKSYRLGRVMWAEKHGPIAPGLMLCHKCDTPRCVNIEHFFLGTPKENTEDMIRKGRKRVVRGDEHGNTKISDRDVEIVRARRAKGETLSSIAADYGVTFQTISYISRGLRKCA